MKIFYREKAFHARKKIRKMTLPPQKKTFLLRPCFQVYLSYTQWNLVNTNFVNIKTLITHNNLLMSFAMILFVKGTIGDSLRLKKSSNLSEIKKKPVNHNMYHFSSKYRINLTEKRLFIRFHSVGPEHCFSPWKKIS